MIAPTRYAPPVLQGPAQDPPDTPSTRRRTRPRRAVATSMPLRVLYAFWVVVLFEPQWWLVRYGVSPAGKLAPLMFVVMAAALVVAGRRIRWHLPVLLLVAFVGLTTPVAVNPAYSLTAFKTLAVFLCLGVATLTLVEEVRHAWPILWMAFVGQFAWWVLHGVYAGRVSWHPNLNNFDGYGPLMTVGIGMCAFFAFAVPSARMKRFAFALAALCLAGVVASFARGAVLSAAALLGWLWLRAPNKGRVSAALIGAAVVVIGAASLFSGVARGGNADSPAGFWQEMSTIFEDVEGGNGGTGDDRKFLWHAATLVFKQYPILGAGASGFGVAAAQFDPEVFAFREIDNPAVLYDRALHSSYYQILSEAGVVGSLIYAWILVDFLLRNAALRRRAAIAHWEGITGGRLDLRYLSLALEAGMVGFLTTAVFYNQLYVHWLFTLVTLNVLLWHLTNPATGARGTRQRQRAAR